MQVTFNPQNTAYTLNAKQNAHKNNNTYNTYNPNFKANAVQIGEDVVETLAGSSRIFDPIKKKWNAFIELGARKLVGPLLDLGPVGWFAEKTRNIDMVNHLNVLGSAVTSGLYVKKTLDNKKLDEDRRRTLAINQILVFIVSTAGSYLANASLDNLWENVTARYAGLKLGIPDLNKNFKAYNKEIKLGNKGVEKSLQKPLMKAKDYMKKIAKVDPLKLESIDRQMRGMNVAKKLFVFSMVYRYISPVVVTPIANKLGDAWLNYKRSKKEAQPQEVKTAA